jgi:hypothetical protein
MLAFPARLLGAARGPGIFLALGACLVAATSCSGDGGDLAEPTGAAEAPLLSPPGDASGLGPLATTSGDYQLPATIDPDVMSDRYTELWARVYRPQDLSGGPFPLVVFLHGNHATCGDTGTPRQDKNCEYTTYGTCSGAYPVIVQNHLGYAYAADRLASWGYLVVSINANRGITCGTGVTGDAGLNLARGRLILKHLVQLSSWNRSPGTTPPSVGVDLAGKIDFGNVGMMGHSRAGEGIRAALAQYLDAGSPWPARIVTPLTFAGLFEIGGNDGQTSRVLNALGTSWNALLPGCDNDNYTLEGVKPFDRMLASTADAPATPKSYTLVRGANHRFYNTEWQVSDATGCTGTNNAPIFSPTDVASPQQQATFQKLGMAFFRAHLASPVAGAFDASFASTFDPMSALNPAISAVTQVDRSWVASPDDDRTALLDNMITGTAAGNYVNASITTVPEHDPSLRAALVSWTTASSAVWYERDWSPVGQGVDLSQDRSIDFRVSRPTTSTGGPVDFTIRLVYASGKSGTNPVSLSSYLSLDADPGGTRATHPLLRTVRIPLSDFTGATLTAVRGIRFVFNVTANNSVYLTDIRRTLGGPTMLARQVAASAGPVAVAARPAIRAITEGNAAPRVRALRSPDPALDGGVTIELASAEPFPVDDALPVLRIGDVEVNLGGYPPDGDTHRLIFRVGPADLRRLHGGEPMIVQYGPGDAPAVRWHFGPFEPGPRRR